MDTQIKMSEFFPLKSESTHFTPIKSFSLYHPSQHPANVKIIQTLIDFISLLGRPFIVELTNPRRVSFTQEEMTSIQTRANSATKDIKIRDLQIVSR